MPDKRRFPALIDRAGTLRFATPLEWERIMGFPDNWTDIPWGTKGTAPKTHRYKAIGNSMDVRVMRWIGRRIQQWEIINAQD